MEFKVESPSVLLPKISGTYKLCFSNGDFYFGSTQDLRDKIQNYESDIKWNKKLTKNIWSAIKSSEWMKIEILALCYNKQEALKIEDRYIKIFFGNPHLLNRSPSAYSSKGLKRTEEEIKKQKESVTPEMRAYLSKLNTGNCNSAHLRKPVAKLDLEGNLIETYPSLTHAAMAVNSHTANLRRYLYGYGITWKGFLFRFVDESGNIKERPYKPYPKKRGRKKGCSGPNNSGLINGGSKKAFENRMKVVSELSKTVES